MPMISVRDYVDIHGGGLCPYCKSSDIVGGDLDFEGSRIFQEVSCSECHSDWHDIYRLSGYTMPREGD